MAIRGVPKTMQIQPTERMIQIGPDFWGLVDRDVGGNDHDNEAKLTTLCEVLRERQRNPCQRGGTVCGGQR